MHGLGDDIDPEQQRRERGDDASMREDVSPEAEARRRRAREEILRRAQVMQERRGQSQSEGSAGSARSNAQSFDDIVDTEGKLKRAEEEMEGKQSQQGQGSMAATTTAAEPAPADEGLRKRKADIGLRIDTREDTPATVVKSESPSSLLDETNVTSPGLPQPLLPRSSTAAHTFPASPTSPSEQAAALTPTTSRAPSTFPRNSDIRTPSTPAGASPKEPRSPARSPRSPRVHSPQPPTDFRSVQEWAEASTASFYSPPPSDGGAGRLSSVASVVGSEAMSEGELLSEVGSALRTPETWTEVGSVLSEEL